MTMIVGEKVKLENVEAYEQPTNIPTTITGEFWVEEFQPYEPSNYCFEAGYTVFAADESGLEYFVPLQMD